MALSLRAAKNIISEVGLANLTEKELKMITYPLVRSAKGKIETLEKHGVQWDSPAYNKFVSTRAYTYMGDTKNLTRNQRLEMLHATYTFLEKKTGSVRGTKEYVKWFEKTTGLTGLSPEQKRAVYSLRDIIENQRGDLLVSYGYENILELASKGYKEGDMDYDRAKENILDVLDLDKGLDFQQISKSLEGEYSATEWSKSFI